MKTLGVVTLQIVIMTCFDAVLEVLKTFPNRCSCYGFIGWTNARKQKTLATCEGKCGSFCFILQQRRFRKMNIGNLIES